MDMPTQCQVHQYSSDKLTTFIITEQFVLYNMYIPVYTNIIKLQCPSSFRREVEVEEIRQEEVETAIHKMKKARRQGQMKCG